jgi:hypothetical protein
VSHDARASARPGWNRSPEWSRRGALTYHTLPAHIRLAGGPVPNFILFLSHVGQDYIYKSADSSYNLIAIMDDNNSDEVMLLRIV